MADAAANDAAAKDSAAAATGGAPAAAKAAEPVTDDARVLLDWHWANLEYGCSAPLDAVSLAHWNQDEEHGGFGGPHCMVAGGYDQVVKALGAGVDVRLGAPVASVLYGDALAAALAAERGQGQQQQEDGGAVKEEEQQQQQQQQDGGSKEGKQPQQPEPQVRITTAGGEVFDAALAIVTVPLGVLKAGALAFDPPLPPWKAAAVERLGFGDLNKVVLQFEAPFWDESLDYFGCPRPGGAGARGRCFCFWNLGRFAGAPLLAALVSGAAARDAETASDADLVAAALDALRAAYGDRVTAPVAAHATRWASDPYARGSYSYVAVGASGDDYDKLALPVGGRVLFAGEHTTKEHPDTVGGAILTGVREAAHALRILRGGDDGGGGGSGGESERERSKARRAREEDDEAGMTKEERRAAKKARKEAKRKERRAGGGRSGSDEEGGEEDEDAGRGARANGESPPRAQWSWRGSRELCPKPEQRAIIQSTNETNNAPTHTQTNERTQNKFNSRRGAPKARRPAAPRVAL